MNDVDTQQLSWGPLAARPDQHSRAKEEACLKALRAFERESSAIGARRQRLFRSRIHIFLQYLTVRTDHTVDDATSDVVAAWLDPVRGLWEHDLRNDTLEMLARWVPNPALKQPRQPGRPRDRMLRECVFWRDHHRELCRRTKSFFESITQEGILEDEMKCEPFYRALHAAYPTLGESGVFNDSDEEIVSVLRDTRVSRSPNIVDIGCGGGRLLRRLALEYPGAHMVGTSIFQFSEEQTRRLIMQGIKPLYCTANRVDLDDGSQDLVVSTEVIEHLRHPEELVSEIARVLRPGGVFCITAPSKASYMYGPNPTTYVAAAFSAIAPSALPPFHDLYAPLTPIRFVHYGFSIRDFERLFRGRFRNVNVFTSRFTSLRKFRLDGVAAWLPLLRSMGGLCIAAGRK